MKRNKRAEYFEKMRDTIVEDLKDGRDMYSLAGSIAVSEKEMTEFMIANNLKDLYGRPETLHPPLPKSDKEI